MADGEAVAGAFNAGGRRALTLTAMIPGGMAAGFLILLLYFKSIGGYKVIRLDEDGNSTPDSLTPATEST